MMRDQYVVKDSGERIPPTTSYRRSEEPGSVYVVDPRFMGKEGKSEIGARTGQDEGGGGEGGGRYGGRGGGERKKTTCGQAWSQFCQDTTLHGLRYIWMGDTFIARRLVWLALTLVCSVLMGMQVVDRIVYFRSWPVTVNVEINFNSSLQFPAVTLCNQNAFRATQAAKNGQFQLISEMFTDTAHFNISDIERYGANNVTLADLYLPNAHRKEDFIVSCAWKGEACSPEDFTPVWTDHAYCFRFNLSRLDGDSALLKVQAAGAESGLALTLNVEQYEYMPGPHSASGVKVHLHLPQQFPKVHELGLAVPNGGHSFMGIQLVSVNDLPKPHGDCASPELQLFPGYTLENCEVECLTHLLNNTCGCRLAFLPSLDGSPPVCTLEKYYTCVRPNSVQISDLIHYNCSCPTPCAFRIFDPTVTYSKISELAVDQILQDVNRTALLEKFSAAREATHRLLPERATVFRNLLDNVQMRQLPLEMIVLRDLSRKMVEQNVSLEGVYDDVTEAWEQVHWAMRYQEFAVEKDFVRARTAMEERTFNVMASDFQGFAFKVEDIIEQLASSDLNDSSVRETLFRLLNTRINVRLKICDNALQNYTQLYNAYKHGNRIFHYKFPGGPNREENVYIYPRKLLQEALTYSPQVKARVLRMKRDIVRIQRYLVMYRDLAANAYINGTLNDTEMYFVNIYYMQAYRNFHMSKSLFLYDAVEWPTLQLQERRRKFEQQRHLLEAERSKMAATLCSLSELLSQLNDSLLQTVSEGLDMGRRYLATGEYGKLTIARHLTSPQVKMGIADFKVFFDAVRSKGQTLYDQWGFLLSASLDIWKSILEDEHLQGYYEYKGLDQFLAGTDNTTANLTREVDGYRIRLDLRPLLGSMDLDYLSALEELLDHAQAFLATHRIDHHFLEDNFLKLNIFYRQLSYEQVTQQEAYDVFALLCDIGGSMGLFLGASAITAFEIVDFIWMQAHARILGKH